MKWRVVVKTKLIPSDYEDEQVKYVNGDSAKLKQVISGIIESLSDDEELIELQVSKVNESESVTEVDELFAKRQHRVRKK